MNNIVYNPVVEMGYRPLSKKSIYEQSYQNFWLTKR